MDPQPVFCPNLDCPARGQTGKGNIHVHSLKEHRYLCDVCAKTFTETQGTVFYRLRNDTEQVPLVLALLAHGYPVCAIVFAFGLDERTVRNWEQRAGHHSEQVHQHLVQQPRERGAGASRRNSRQNAKGNCLVGNGFASLDALVAWRYRD